MVSRTPSFDTSFDLKFSGSSRTSPSRLPRRLVEYQPRMPSIRDLKPGARIVFINVWPVLKSLPPIGTPLRSASSSLHGKSHHRLGSPFEQGTRDCRAAAV